MYDLDLIKHLKYLAYEAIVLAVAHEKYKEIKFDNNKQVIFDIKSILEYSDGSL